MKTETSDILNQLEKAEYLLIEIQKTLKDVGMNAARLRCILKYLKFIKKTALVIEKYKEANE